MRSRVGTALAALLWGIGVSVAIACMEGMPRHELSAELQGIDSVPPSRPKVELVGVKRGRAGRVTEDGMVKINSTDDLGVVSVRVLSLEDDISSPENIGLRVVVVGEPSELSQEMVPDYDFRPFHFAKEDYPTFAFVWIDGRSNTQEPIAEKFAIYAIDEAGNVSIDADTLEVVDAGRM